METVEFLILRNLLHNEEYVRKVIPFIKSDYFEDYNQKVVFEEISKFVGEYNQPASKEVLCIETEKRQDINDTSFQEITTLITNLENEFDNKQKEEIKSNYNNDLSKSETLTQNSKEFPSVQLSVKNPISSKVLVFLMVLQVFSNIGIFMLLLNVLE